MEKSSFGRLGLFDGANSFAVEHHSNDFGVTRRRSGVWPRPHLLLALVNPMTVQDLDVGNVAGLDLNPLTPARGVGDVTVARSNLLASGFNTLANAEKNLKVLAGDATDLYASVKSHYLRPGRP